MSSLPNNNKYFPNGEEEEASTQVDQYCKDMKRIHQKRSNKLGSGRNNILL
jgi:hypothetical protein